MFTFRTLFSRSRSLQIEKHTEVDALLKIKRNLKNHPPPVISQSFLDDTNGKAMKSTRAREKRSHVKIEKESESVSTESVVSPSTSSSVSAVTVEKNTDVTENKDENNEGKERKAVKESKWEPIDWKIVLENINKMRQKKDAPVDTMGCERTMEENVATEVRRYQTLISLMLSSQTKDQVTFAAMERLKAAGLTIQNILDTDETALGQIIKPVGFYTKKAAYIKKSTQILREKYGDDIPNTIEGLCSLPGVGPKMGYICMNVAWGQNVGIGVDTHVHRISNRLKWTGTKETKTPEKTREALESWLPLELWQETNILLVGFGQTVCLPVNPKCADCLNNTLCPYGKSMLRGQKKKGTKEPKTAEEEEETSKYF